MSHDRTESASSASGGSSSSTSLHLPSIDSQDSTTHIHDGLYRAHRANNLTASHAARPNALDSRARASPVKLRFIRSPTSGTISSTATSSGSGSGSGSSSTQTPITAAASRIPLPRSMSAPEKLKDRSNDDAVQLASYPTPPLPSSALSPKLPHINLDQPPRKEQAQPSMQGHPRPYIASNARIPAANAAASPSQQSSVLHQPGTPLRSPHALANAHSVSEGQSPTPPKRHPLRPVLQTAHFLNTGSSNKPAPSSSGLSVNLEASANSKHQGPSLFPALGASNHDIDQLAIARLAGPSDTSLLTPASAEDDSSAPNSAIFTSAFSSPLDSASVPRSFLQQQQQLASSNLRSISEDPIVQVNAEIDSRRQVNADDLEHKHSFSNASEQSIASARTREREHSAEEEILASTVPSVIDDTLASPEFGIASPGLLSSQIFNQISPGPGTTFIGTATTVTRLQRSHSLSSSISSMSSSLTGSESFSSHDHQKLEKFHTRQRRIGQVDDQRLHGAGSVGHSESFLNLKDVTATPKQARKVSSSSDLHSVPPHDTGNTPRATPSHQTSSATAIIAAAAPKDVTDVVPNTSPFQTPDFARLAQRKRDGTFGMTRPRNLDQESKAESPSSIHEVQSTPLRPRREDSNQSSSTGHGNLPRSGTVGDLSFSGSPSLTDAVVKASPRPENAAEMSFTSNGGVTKASQRANARDLSSVDHPSTPSGSASASGGALASNSSTTLAIIHSDKVRDGLGKSRSRRPAAVQHSSSTMSAQSLTSREIKVPIMPGMEEIGIRGATDGSTEIKKSWKKAGQDYPKWDISQPLWYKAPQWGRLPQKGMRANSATVVPNISPLSSVRSGILPARSPEPELFALDPVFSPVGSSLYIFGGCDSKHCFKDLYKLDLQSFQWSKPRTAETQNSPPALRAHSVIYVPPFQSLHSSIYDNLEVKDHFPDDPDVINVRMKSTEGHLLFFGGGDGPNYFNDIYLLNLTTMSWSKPLPAPSTTVLDGEKSTGSPHQAGLNSIPYSNTQHVFGTLPSPRRAHTALWYDKRKEMIIFGGGNGTKALNEVWVLECKDWKKLNWKSIDALGKKPRVRGYHTMNLLGNKAIIFGGSDGSECFSDVFVLDLDTFTWTEIPIYEPSLHCPRLSHSSTLISPTQLLILGGHNGTDYKKDITVFSLATGKFYNITNATALSCYSTMGPSRRGYHSACLSDGRIIMLGGYDGKKHYDEVWCLEVTAIAACRE